MCLNTVGNTLLPLLLFGGKNAPAASNLGNTFFGLGAFIVPFIIGMLLRRLGYKAAGTIISIVFLLPIIVAVMAVYPEIPGGFSFSDIFGLLANPVILTAGFALFCYISLEVSMGGWITTYLTEQDFTERSASLMLSAFWVSIMVARLVTATMVNPEIGAVVIAVLAIISCVSISIMVITKSKPLAAASVILTGLVFGPMFPTIVGVTFSNIDASLFGSAFGIIFAIGLLGGSTVPAAIGIYAKGKTIQKSLKILIAAAFILFIFALVLNQFKAEKLFDGSNFDAWKMNKTNGWVIEDDTMALKEGGDIWTKERFGDFVLDLEFKVSSECNSGIFFRTADLKDPVQTGIELQVLDSAGKPNPDKHDSGAMYDLLEPSSNTMKSDGEWNHVIITCKDNLIKVNMNGTQIIDMDLDKWTIPQKNPDGTNNKFKTALKDFSRDGHIGFQDHGHPVWYRNVKIK